MYLKKTTLLSLILFQQTWGCEPGPDFKGLDQAALAQCATNFVRIRKLEAEVAVIKDAFSNPKKFIPKLDDSDFSCFNEPEFKSTAKKVATKACRLCVTKRAKYLSYVKHSTTEIDRKELAIRAAEFLEKEIKPDFLKHKENFFKGIFLSVHNGERIRERCEPTFSEIWNMTEALISDYVVNDTLNAISAERFKRLHTKIEKIESGKLAGKYLQELGLDEHIKPPQAGASGPTNIIRPAVLEQRAQHRALWERFPKAPAASAGAGEIRA